MSGTVSCARDIAGNKMHKNLCFHAAFIPVGVNGQFKKSYSMLKG